MPQKQEEYAETWTTKDVTYTYIVSNGEAGICNGDSAAISTCESVKFFVFKGQEEERRERIVLKIEKKLDDRCLTVTLIGVLDSITSPELDRELQNMENVDEVILDLKELAYTSSAGLRVIMGLKRRLAGRPLKLENIGTEVREILDMTGSSKLLGL